MGVVYLGVHLKWPTGILTEKLALVGRTALTNYLLQSLVAAIIFQGWGLGWYGQLGSLQTALLATGLTGLQIIWPGWWLQPFRFGPMEYLRRRMIYGSENGPIRRTLG